MLYLGDELMDGIDTEVMKANVEAEMVGENLEEEIQSQATIPLHHEKGDNLFCQNFTQFRLRQMQPSFLTLLFHLQSDNIARVMQIKVIMAI